MDKVDFLQCFKKLQNLATNLGPVLALFIFLSQFKSHWKNIFSAIRLCPHPFFHKEIIFKVDHFKNYFLH